MKNINFKGMIETVKTVVLAALVAGVISFIAGVHYQSNQDNHTQAAVKAASTAQALK